MEAQKRIIYKSSAAQDPYQLEEHVCSYLGCTLLYRLAIILYQLFLYFFKSTFN